MRFVILLSLILLAVLFYRWRRSRRPMKDYGPSAREAPQVQAVPTVRCTACGLVLPEKEALRLNGQAFCSAEHARSWQERHPR